MPCCCSTAPGGTRPASSTCPPISPRSSCRREPRNSTQSKTSGSISARTGSQTPSSKTMTLSSTRLAAHGESSPPSPKRSRPSECEHGRMSVSPHDRWYYGLTRPAPHRRSSGFDFDAHQGRAECDYCEPCERVCEEQHPLQRGCAGGCRHSDCQRHPERLPDDPFADGRDFRGEGYRRCRDLSDGSSP